MTLTSTLLYVTRAQCAVQEPMYVVYPYYSYSYINKRILWRVAHLSSTLTPVMSLLHASQEWMVGSAFGSMLMAASLSSLLAATPIARKEAKSRPRPSLPAV